MKLENADVHSTGGENQPRTPNHKPDAHESELGVRYNDDHDSI
jgi:hypothetical protein